MKLALMQPYFFPYLGYFDLIYQADLWIVFDTVQYIRRGWINRNRVLHQTRGWQYITVPVRKRPRDARICEMEIANDLPWREKLLGQLQHYKRHAPYFSQVMHVLEAGIASSDEVFISRLNVRCLELVCEYLDIPFHYRFLSDMNLDIGPIHAPDDWALHISKALGAKEYINPPGGKDIYDPDKFRRHGIRLTIRQLPVLEYECNGYEFIPNLSIIDVLMWNQPAKVRGHLERHR